MQSVPKDDAVHACPRHHTFQIFRVGVGRIEEVGRWEIILAFYVFRVTVGTRFLPKIRVCSCSSFSTNTAYYNVIHTKKKRRREKSDKKINT